MKINQIQNSQNFNGLYNNKILLKSLEKISEHGASFAAVTSFAAASVLRPAVVSILPNVDKENKKAFSAESIASATMKLLIALGVSMPIENAIKKIDVEPLKYLEAKNLKNYKFLSQIIKLGTNLITAIPKSLLTVALIPILMNLFNSKEKNKIDTNLNQKTLNNPNFISFKGNKLPQMLANLIESNQAQKFANEFSSDGKNIARNMSVLSDILLTTTSVISTKKSKKIDDKRKKPLILNKVISSSISIFAGFSIDKIAQKLGAGVVEKIKQANLNDKNISKYIEGINILRPTIIFALIYYGIIPVISALSSDKISKKTD